MTLLSKAEGPDFVQIDALNAYVKGDIQNGQGAL
jgi:hypothetical protein